MIWELCSRLFLAHVADSRYEKTNRVWFHCWRARGSVGVGLDRQRQDLRTLGSLTAYSWRRRHCCGGGLNTGSLNGADDDRWCRLAITRRAAYRVFGRTRWLFEHYSGVRR